MALHFKNFESLHPQMTFVKFGQNWLMRRWHWKWQPDKVTQGFGSGGWITQFQTALLVYFMMTIWQEWTKADPAPACWACAPLFENFYGCIFGNFDFITHINLIVINIQCILFSTLTTKAYSICVKGHQNNLQTSKNISRRDRAHGFFNFWIRHWWILPDNCFL